MGHLRSARIPKQLVTPGHQSLYAAMARSIRYRRTEPVWPRGSLEEAELDQEPDRADDRDKPNQHPPAGFVTVVEALDMDEGRARATTASCLRGSPLMQSVKASRAIVCWRRCRASSPQFKQSRSSPSAWRSWRTGPSFNTRARGRKVRAISREVSARIIPQ